MTVNNQSIFSSKYAKILATIGTVGTVVSGLWAVYRPPVEVIHYLEEVLPPSMARLIPGAGYNKFDEAAFQALTNPYVTDAKLIEWLGAPVSERPLEDGTTARSYQSKYGNIYIERKANRTQAVSVNAPRASPKLQTFMNSVKLPTEITYAKFREDNFWELAYVQWMGDSSNVWLVKLPFIYSYRFNGPIRCGAERRFSVGIAFKGLLQYCDQNDRLKGYLHSLAREFADPTKDADLQQSETLDLIARAETVAERMMR